MSNYECRYMFLFGQRIEAQNIVSLSNWTIQSDAKTSEFSCSDGTYLQVNYHPVFILYHGMHRLVTRLVFPRKLCSTSPIHNTTVSDSYLTDLSWTNDLIEYIWSVPVWKTIRCSLYFSFCSSGSAPLRRFVSTTLDNSQWDLTDLVRYKSLHRGSSELDRWTDRQWSWNQRGKLT